MKIATYSTWVAVCILLIPVIWYSVGRIGHRRAPVSVFSFIDDATGEEAPQNGSLKFAAYNIAHGRGGKYGAKNWSHDTEKELKEHLDHIAGQIQAERPDIVVLNEIDFSARWSFNINQACYLAEKCGYPYLLEQTNMDVSFPFFRFRFGNALLSRYPVAKERFVDFPPYSRMEDLFAGNHDGFFCEIQSPDGPIGVFGIHMEYRSEGVRVRCARVLTDMCAKMDFPVIALGDFNSTPPSLPKSKVSGKNENAMMFLFHQKGFVSYLNEADHHGGFTFPSENPDRRIDWIIGKGIGHFSNSKILKSYLSDHLMIVTELLGSDSFVQN